MRMKLPVVVVLAGIHGFLPIASNPATAQWAETSAAQWAGTGGTPPPTPELAAAGDVKSVVFKWMWYMGMLRNWQELDHVAMFELRKSTGTIRVAGQPCELENYRASINYQVSGMRAQYECTLPNGPHSGIEVVSGQIRGEPNTNASTGQWPGGMFAGPSEDIFAWDSDVIGAGLADGQGTATPNGEARNERLIRLWAGPWGAPKAAAADSDATVVMEEGKPVVTFAIPFVQGATAQATLNSNNQAERIEVRLGNVVTEFIYENYADYNPADDQIMGYTPGHIVEKRDGVTVLDITVAETHVGNLYVVVPVPDSVRNASSQ